MSKDCFTHPRKVYEINVGYPFITETARPNYLTAALSEVIGTLDIAVWQLDLEYRIVGHNEKAGKIYGDNIIGNFCYRLADRQNRVCRQCSAKQVYGGSTGACSDHESVDAAGNRIYNNHIAAPIRNEQGALTGVIVFIVEMTNHKRMKDEPIHNIKTLEKIVRVKNQALVEIKAECRDLFNQTNAHEALSRSLLEASADAVLIYDMRGHVKYLTRRFTEIFGWRPDDLVNHKIPFVPPMEIEDTHEKFQKTMDDGALVKWFKTKRLTKDNRILAVNISVAKYMDHQNRPGGMRVTFNSVLPGTLKQPESAPSEAPDIAAGNETILLLDDEKMVLDVGRPMLEKIGYTVLVAASGMQAIDIYEKQPKDIQLVIIDMIMPEMNGGQVYDALKQRDPDVKVLLSSGYTMTGDAEEILSRGCNGFIQKPFGMVELSQKIRMILDD